MNWKKKKKTEEKNIQGKSIWKSLRKKFNKILEEIVKEMRKKKMNKTAKIRNK